MFIFMLSANYCISAHGHPSLHVCKSRPANDNTVLLTHVILSNGQSPKCVLKYLDQECDVTSEMIYGL